MNHNLNVVQADDRLLTVNGRRFKNIYHFQQIVKDSTPPITLKIRRLRRNWNIPTTYIVNYDPGATIGLILRMLPFIRSEVMLQL